MPFFKSKGNEIKRASEGMTNQKMLVANALTFSIFFVSMYSQIIAKTETKGIEANIAPTNELRFEISEITTINIVVIKIFIM